MKTRTIKIPILTEVTICLPDPNNFWTVGEVRHPHNHSKEVKDAVQHFMMLEAVHRWFGSSWEICGGKENEVWLFCSHSEAQMTATFTIKDGEILFN